MKNRSLLFGFLALVLAGFACASPPSLPLPGLGGDKETESTDTPKPLPDGMPYVETDYDKMFETLTSGQAGVFEEFAAEQYEEADYAGPNELTYTVKIPASQTIFWNYGWCAADEDTLVDNLSHINVIFYFDGEEIPNGWAQTVGNTADNGWECAVVGLLLSDWEPGNYQFEIVATFDTQINDGGADFEAGDYVFKYDVAVE